MKCEFGDDKFPNIYYNKVGSRLLRKPEAR